MTAADIAREAGGAVATGSPDAQVTSWAFDSRVLEPGACFVALHGDRDGHDFVAARSRAAHASRSSPGSIPRSSCPTAQPSCASTTRCTPCRPWPHAERAGAR